MANANISAIQVTNTFDEWRVATNDLIQDRNILRNKTYVKDESDLQLANGALTLSRSTGGVLLTITGSGGALVGGTTTTSDLTVQDDASVANNLTVSGNVIASGNVTVGRNVNVAMELAVTGNVSVNVDKFTIDANTGNVTAKGDIILNGGDLVSTANANVVNTSSDTVSLGGAAATVRIGSTGGTTILRGKANVTGTANLLAGATVTGDLAVSNGVIVTANSYLNANVNVGETIYVNGIVASRFKNVDISNIATIDNAFITTLTITNPIQSLGTGANSWSLRMGSSSDAEGFFRVTRSVASGNVDIWWDETDDTWKFVRNYPNHGNERANLSATLKSVRDFVINTTASATQTVDLSLSNWFRYTLNQNTTIQFANAPASGVGITATLLINQDGTGSRTLTFANTVYFANGSPPTPSTNANSEDMWTFTTYDGGQSFIGALAIKDSFVRRIPDGLIEYMIVGGGAGGGLTTSLGLENDGGGGGGGGGVREGTSLNIASNTTYTITVGSGGAAGYSLGLTSSAPWIVTETDAFNGANGGSSSISASAPFTTITAAGGGAGGGSYTYPGTNPGYVENGAVGGSGGGGGMAAYDRIVKSIPRSGGGGSRNIPWNTDLPYTFSTPTFANRRDIIFGGNATTNAAQTAWTAYWDSANDHFFHTFASPGIGGGVGLGLGGAGNTPSTTPAQGNNGGRAGYLYTNNLHSTKWNTMPGYIGNQTSATNPNLPAIPDATTLLRVEALYAFIVGGVGRGGGGGAGGVGGNGVDLQIGPPYGGLLYNTNPGTDPTNNPVGGQPAAILAGSQKGGNGGIGLTSTISGSSVIYGAGGGGYGFSIAGLGGGGVSANGAGNAGTGGHFTYQWGNTAPSAPAYTGNNVVFAGNGTTNRGGGGGGGACKSGAGGSGVVIIRYPIRSVNGKVLYIPASSNTGSPTYTESGGYRIYTFTGSGSITWAV